MSWFFKVFDSLLHEEIIYLSNLKKKDTYTKKVEGITMKMRISIESGDEEDQFEEDTVEIYKILSIPEPFKR